MLSPCLRSLTLFNLFICGISLSSFGFAADRTETRVKDKNRKATDSRNEIALDQDSSQQIRTSQKYGADILYTPLSGFILQYGGSLNYKLEPDISLELTGLFGSRSLNASSSENGIEAKSRAKIDGMAVYAAGRYFFGNSFNGTVGLGLRTASIKYTVTESTTPVTLNGKINIESIVLPIFIGNRWTFPSGFTIGCDWIGVMVALSGSAKSSLDGNLPNTSVKTLNDEILNSFTSLSRSSSFTLFLTSVGWAF